ncbi:hypothetical protein [Phenylobacterium sp.]|uniref:hypothetical protein n=1 Tax=Phenylobacterium sp. TaxID=1871053 RepID=UPI003561320D
MRSPRQLGIAALAVAGVMLPVWLVGSTWMDRVALQRQWTIAGPACPIVAKPDRAVVGRRSPQFFEYQGIRFGRQSGEVSCVAPPEGHPLDPKSYAVCQFPAPVMVSVDTGQHTVIFQPGLGRRATVTVRRGEVSCVLAGWFKG